MKIPKWIDKEACERINLLFNRYWSLQDRIEQEHNLEIKKILKLRQEKIGKSLIRIHLEMCKF